jgi:DNA-binding SARP family transcriptional activator
MELLKALIAFGARDVAQERLMDALWPDALGDAALRSLNTTLHRLRKAIGIDRAIILKDRHITLDPAFVWLDVCFVERTLSQIEHLLSSAEGCSDTIERLWASVNGHYAGPFLGNGPHNSWSIGLAERLRSRMIRCTLAVGCYWEEQSECDRAIGTYQKGLEIVSLIEVFYQRVMHCYERLQRPAEAIATYERCRRVLAEALKVAPGEETVRLYLEIRSRAESSSPMDTTELGIC